jgi:hypothetical protein
MLDMKAQGKTLIAAAVVLILAGGAVAAIAATGRSSTSPSVRTEPAQAPRTGAPIRETLKAHGYRIDVRITPNRTSAIDVISVRLRNSRGDVRGTRVRLTTTMTTMAMGYTGLLTSTGRGRYVHRWPPLEMPGTWRFKFAITSPAGNPFSVTLIARVS